MPSDAESPETLADNAVRSFALGRATAVTKYGDLLTRFARRELEPGDFAQESVKYAFEEGIRYAQDTATLASSYLGAVAKIGRPEPAKRAMKAKAPARKRTRAKK